MDEFHGYLDRFSVLGQCIVCEGWANHLDLALWYRDRPLTLSTVRVDRPDLVSVMGPGTAGWGFSFAAALPERDVDRTKFRLRFNAGLTVDPTKLFAHSGDARFTAMVDRFKAMVRPGSSLLEIGSRARSGATYRDWFPAELDYTGLDVTDGPNVDVVADAHHMARVLGRQFDHAFSMATFEHILMPWKVALELNAMLRPGGTALIISHGAWPLHEQPWDFFRFSTDSWRGIFNAHTGFQVLDAQYQHSASVVPHYQHSGQFTEMSWGPAFLLSGCLIERTGPARVHWDAEAADVYDLGYSHQ